MTQNNTILDKLDAVFEKDGYCKDVSFSKQFAYISYVLKDATDFYDIVDQSNVLTAGGETVKFRSAMTNNAFIVPSNYVSRDDAETLKSVFKDYRQAYKKDYLETTNAIAYGKRFKTQLIILGIISILFTAGLLFSNKSDSQNEPLLFCFFVLPFVAISLLKIFEKKIKCNNIVKAIIIGVGLIVPILFVVAAFSSISIFNLFTNIIEILFAVAYFLPYLFFALSLKKPNNDIYDCPSEIGLNLSIDQMMQNKLKEELLENNAYKEICSMKYKDIVYKNTFPTYDNSNHLAKYLEYSDVAEEFTFPTIEEAGVESFHFSNPAFNASYDDNIIRNGKLISEKFEYFNLKVAIDVLNGLLRVGLTYRDIIDVYQKNYDRIQNVNDINRLLDEKYKQENRDYQDLLYKQAMYESQKKVEKNTEIAAQNSEISKDYQYQQLVNQQQQYAIQNWYSQEILDTARRTESAVWWSDWR